MSTTNPLPRKNTIVCEVKGDVEIWLEVPKFLRFDYFVLAVLKYDLNEFFSCMFFDRIWKQKAIKIKIDIYYV